MPITKLGVYALLRAMCGGAVIQFTERTWLEEICLSDDYQIAVEISDDSEGPLVLELCVINLFTCKTSEILVCADEVDVTNICELDDFEEKIKPENQHYPYLYDEVAKRTDIKPFNLNPFAPKVDISKFCIYSTFVGECVGEEDDPEKAEYSIYHAMKNGRYSYNWLYVILMLIRSLESGSEGC
jgi:hypothetical protein